MKKEEFYAELKTILQTDCVIDESTIMKDIEEWDSLGIISLVSILEQKYKVKTDYATLTQCLSAKDIYEKVFLHE